VGGRAKSTMTGDGGREGGAASPATVPAAEPAGPAPQGRGTGRARAWRRRWLSRRSLGLHLAVSVVAPGCAVAGWWQATRALAGNELSWAYSVEWPVFSLLAIAGWWILVHEDPVAYRARRARREPRPTATSAPPPAPSDGDDEMTGALAHLVTRLAVATGGVSVLGVVALVFVPLERPSGWLPAQGEVVYLLHALGGLALTGRALELVVRGRRSGRVVRIVGWTGAAGVAMAGVGGLLTEAHSALRFLGIAVMFVGAVWAGFAYLVPTLLRRQQRARDAVPRSTGGSVGNGDGQDLRTEPAGGGRGERPDGEDRFAD
jgi:hypothetical protein